MIGSKVEKRAPRECGLVVLSLGSLHSEACASLRPEGIPSMIADLA